MFSDLSVIISAIFSGDLWALKTAMQSFVIWPVSLVIILLLSFGLNYLYRKYTWTERNLERYIMVVSYLAIGAIIFVEVVRRFVFNVQVPWSTTLPPFLFLIMAWFGCSYNVKHRTHLAFSEFRAAMPRKGQFALLWLDALLWIGFAWVVIVTSTRVVINSALNFQIMLGTDSIMQWWFLTAIPLAFICIVSRTIDNLSLDIKNYKSGEKLLQQNAIGSGE